MTANQTIIYELTRERDRLLNEIEKLKTELNVIQKLIDRRLQPESDSVTNLYTQRNSKRPLGAIKELLDKSPNTKFTPAEIRDELEKLRRQNLLKTKSDNLIFAVHSSLRSLLKKNVIEKVFEDDPPTYKLSNTKSLAIKVETKKLKR